MYKYKKYFSIVIAFLFCINKNISAQELLIKSTGTKTSIRGLSVVSDNIIWASGSNGMVAKSIDGGEHFIWQQVPQFEKKDFRDIEAFDSNTAIIMCIAEPAYILKTIDGGKNWKTVFFDSTKGMFLDAMYFKDENNGVVIGDPINEKPFMAFTSNAGETWTTATAFKPQILLEGEAFFASSGTNISMNKKGEYCYVSGGKSSNLFINETKYPLPLIQGIQSTGANSIAIYKNKVIIVGGDFIKENDTTKNCTLFNLKKNEFITPSTYPSGYRSCVTFINKNTVLTCGLNGIDLSKDAGLNWKKISNEGFHVVQKAKNGKVIFLAGSKGRIAKMNL